MKYRCCCSSCCGSSSCPKLRAEQWSCCFCCCCHCFCFYCWSLPDKPFHNFEALKSVARCSCITQNSSLHGFWGSKIVKGLVGFLSFYRGGKLLLDISFATQDVRRKFYTRNLYELVRNQPTGIKNWTWLFCLFACLSVCWVSMSVCLSGKRWRRRKKKRKKKTLQLQWQQERRSLSDLTAIVITLSLSLFLLSCAQPHKIARSVRYLLGKLSWVTHIFLPQN